MPGTAAGADSAAEWGEDGQGEAGGGDRVHRRGNAECTLVRTHWVPGLGAGHPQRRAGATYPQETVQFPHGHLLGSVHSLKHLLLMLGGKGRWALSPRLCSPTCLSVYVYFCTWRTEAGAAAVSHLILRGVSQPSWNLSSSPGSPVPVSPAVVTGTPHLTFSQFLGI